MGVAEVTAFARVRDAVNTEAPAEAPARPSPPPQPASEASLQLLATSFGPRIEASDLSAPLDRKRLAALLQAMARPRAITSKKTWENEWQRLQVAIAGRKDWLNFPQEVQRLLLELVAARGRHLQDETASHQAPLADFKKLFPALSNFSAKHRPGLVHGLARAHEPREDSWIADACARWRDLRILAGLEDARDPEEAPNPERLLAKLEARLAEDLCPEGIQDEARRILDAGIPPRDPRLCRLLLPSLDLLAGPEFKNLRRALRKAQDEMESEPENGKNDDEAERLPPDWPWFHLTRGRRAVIVGGELRPHARDRIQEFFAFTEIDWVGSDRNEVASLSQRFQGDTYDFAILLGGFRSHAADDKLVPVLKEKGIPWVNVKWGYGITSIRQVIERTQPAAPTAS
jgi:hypothetical protein